MKSFGVLDNPVDYTLGVYFHHCAIAMTCRQLALAGRFLALRREKSCDRASGRAAGAGAANQRHHADLRPLRWLRRIRLQSRPAGQERGRGRHPGDRAGRGSIAAWSPGLDAAGNSHLGRLALEILAHRTGWSVFQ